MIGEKIFAHTPSVLSGRVRVGIVAVVLLLFSAPSSYASWQIVYRSPVGNGFRAGYFFSEKVGLIAGNLNDGVYKTTNGGQTWSQTKFPRYVDGSAPNGLVTQILMTTPTTGWLTCEPITDTAHPALPGLYKTTNAGASWVPTSLNGHFSDIYQTTTTLVVTGRDEAATGFISTDGGVSFSPAIPKTNGVDFVDNNYGVVVAYKQQIWSRTTDGGRTWLSLSATDNVESWGVYAVKGTPNFFTAGEGYPAALGDIPSSVRKSTDYGATWSKISNLQFRTTGDIEGFGPTLFVQVCSTDPVSNGFSGIFRSTDGGLAWFPIGGPGNENDTRFAIMGCRGEVIYAFDNLGNVWKTVDGGDGSIPQFQFPATSLKVDSIDVCSPQDTVIAIKNLGCDTIYIIDANAPAQPPLDIFDATTGTTPSFPIIIPPNSSGKLRLSLHAAFSGVYQTRVMLAIMREGVFAFDTITVTSAMKYYNPVRALTAKLQYDSLSLCESFDSTIRISNDSCFTVKIVSSQLKYGQNFVLDTGWTNDSIPPFSSKDFTIRFSPTQQGPDVDSLIVNLSVLGRPVRMSVPVSGFGIPDNPQLVLLDKYGQPLTSLEFGTRTRCDADTIIPFTIAEKGCDSLYVSVEWLDSTMSGPPPASQFKWLPPPARWITKNSTPILNGIEAMSAVLGKYQGYLRIRDSLKGEKATTVVLIPYRVNVVPGSRILGLDSSLRNFDTISYCQTHDSTIVIKNFGCDTLHISQLTLSDPNFIVITPPKLPIDIKPYDSTSTVITVRYLPTVTGSSTGTLTIGTDDTTASVRSIPLQGYASPTDTIKFKAIATNLIVHPGDTSTIEIKASGSFHSKGLNSIQIVLEYNGDVMTPWNVFNVHTDLPGAGTPTVGPMQQNGTKLQLLPINVSGNDMSLDSNLDIARLQFLITLSDSGWTDFRVAKIILNNSDLNFNKCLLGAVTDSGTIDLKFYCGDSLLYKELREGSNFSLSDGIAPARGSAHPNPVTEGASLTIPYHATRDVTVKLQIIDAAGVEVYSSIDNAKGVGDKSMVVPATVIRSGAYHYRLLPIDGGRGSVTGDFVVIR